MEEAVDNSLTPTTPAQPTPFIRADTHAKADAVRTELPARKSVQSAWASDPVENRVSTHAALASRVAEVVKATEQRYERDRDSSTLVYKQIDPTSGEVIMQLPTESVLNLRAYLKQQENSRQAAVRKTA